MVPIDHPDDDDVLTEVLRRAQDLGLVGPGSISDQIAHSRAFTEALARGWTARSVRTGATIAAPPDLLPHPLRLADLGSGGGLPSLVIARRWEDVRLTLIEAQHRRARFLEEAVVELGLEERVHVLVERAEVVGRDPGHRAAYQAVTARSFGPPAVVAECAAPLLEQGGVLVVSEPPTPGGAGDRWPAIGLAELGMGSARFDEVERRFVVISQEQSCPDRYPRRVGIPAKRPLF